MLTNEDFKFGTYDIQPERIITPQCKKCIHHEKRNELEAERKIFCKKYNMISYRDQTCKSGKEANQ